jgi:membrane protease YdiL (CAAX protease family)
VKEPADHDDSEVSQHGLPLSIVLHLLPGAVAVVVYVAIAPFFIHANLPSLLALLTAATICLIPLELGHLLVLGSRRNHRWSLDGIVFFRHPQPSRFYWKVVPVVFVVATLLYVLAAPGDVLLTRHAFEWLPKWWRFTDISKYRQYSRSILSLTFTVRLVFDGMLIPVVEELYFRGYLLPRISRFGGWAPVLNCCLFALYHFWQPFNLPSLLGISLPICVGVWRTKNVYVGVLSHLALNFVGCVIPIAVILLGW